MGLLLEVSDGVEMLVVWIRMLVVREWEARGSVLFQQLISTVIAILGSIHAIRILKNLFDGQATVC